MSAKRVPWTGASIVLRTTAVRESDLVVTLLSADRGRVEAIARGARSLEDIGQHFISVEPPPILPVEAEFAAIGRCRHDHAGTLRIRPRLTQAFHPGAVHREHHLLDLAV